MGDRSLVSWELGFDGVQQEEAPIQALPTGPTPMSSLLSATAAVVGETTPTISRRDSWTLLDMPRFMGADTMEAAQLLQQQQQQGSAAATAQVLPLPPWAVDMPAVTAPPLRLRMVSRDMLVRRSMELQWDDAAGETHAWSSWTDALCGWFEAEKLLPSSATNIKVRFTVHTVVTSFPVCRVDRRNGCAWDTARPPEEICFRSPSAFGSESAGVDAMFELAGPVTGCFVRRAWNAGRNEGVEPEAWECWGDDASRPVRQPQPAVLQAADAAAPPGAHAGNAVKYCASATLRLIAAVKALVDIRCEVLSELKALDQQLTNQWVAVNSANTVSAGLGIAAAVALLAVSTGGMSLLVGSAVTGAGAGTADIMADRHRLSDLRTQICQDAWNAFAVAELEREWCWARRRAAEALSSKVESAASMAALAGKEDFDGATATEMAILAAYGAQFGATVTRVIVEALEEGAQAATVATRAASSTACYAACALGLAAAAVSTGVALHGWTTTKSLKTKVNTLQEDLTSSMLGCVRWLSAMNQLECGICRYAINLSHEAGCCSPRCHFFHARCIQMWREECRARSAGGASPQLPAGSRAAAASAQSTAETTLPRASLEGSRSGVIFVASPTAAVESVVDFGNTGDAVPKEVRCVPSCFHRGGRSPAEAATLCPMCEEALHEETGLLEGLLRAPVVAGGEV